MRKVYGARREALLEALAGAFPGQVEVRGAAADIHLAASFPGEAFTPTWLGRLRQAGVSVNSVSAHTLGDPKAYLDIVLLGYGNHDERRVQEGVRRLQIALAAG